MELSTPTVAATSLNVAKKLIRDSQQFGPMDRQKATSFAIGGILSLQPIISMTDTYPTFAALASAESPDAYSIIVRNSNSRVVIAAPHGGGIEAGTSEIALAIAGQDYSYYIFEGNKATSLFTLLAVTLMSRKALHY